MCGNMTRISWIKYDYVLFCLLYKKNTESHCPTKIEQYTLMRFSHDNQHIFI